MSAKAGIQYSVPAEISEARETGNTGSSAFADDDSSLIMRV
jgi:hypothetical protein